MEISKFLERFYFFYDSVIRDIRISFRNSFAATKIEIIISTRDKESDDWINVRLEISKVTEFSLRENAKTNYQVLSNALHILKAKDAYYFDFGFHVDMPNDSEEFRKSDFYVVGEKWSWKTENYKEIV